MWLEYEAQSETVHLPYSVRDSSGRSIVDGFVFTRVCQDFSVREPRGKSDSDG